MARKNGPDLTNPAENPDFEHHVQNVVNMVNDANSAEHYAGRRWYGRAAGHAMDIRMGHNPGVLTPHETHGEYGVTRPKPGTTSSLSEVRGNAQAEHEVGEIEHAKSLGRFEDLSRTGTYQGQRVSHANTHGAPYGAHAMFDPRLRDVTTNIAANSPAGPTGMTWEHNPRAAYETTHLNDTQFNHIAAANREKPGTPARAEASATAREAFKGKSLNHQTTSNVEKAARADRGEFRGQENPLGIQKTGHFDKDIYNEVHPGGPENQVGAMTGTIDKHQEDVIAGVTKPWGNKDEKGNQVRQSSTRTVGEHGLPSVSSDKGYAYDRSVLHEASSRLGERPKDAQAISWVHQKKIKDTAARDARAAKKNAG